MDMSITNLLIDNRVMKNEIVKLKKDKKDLEREIHNIKRFMIIRNVILLFVIVVFFIHCYFNSQVEFRY